MKRAGMAIAAAAAAALASGTAAAQSLVDGRNPDEVLNLARGFGSAALERDQVGDPLINGRIDGSIYSIWFYGCVNNANCDTLLFESLWQIDQPNLEALNAFNRDAMYGRAYLSDGGDYVIEMTVNLKGGVTRANLDSTFSLWADLLRDFRAFASN